MNKFDPTKPVRTRDGRSARIVCRDAEGKFPIIALVSTQDGEVPRQYTVNGEFYTEGLTSPLDLLNVPETRKVEVWVVAYQDGTVKVYTHKIEPGWGHTAIRRIELEVTEGQYDL